MSGDRHIVSESASGRYVTVDRAELARKDAELTDLRAKLAAADKRIDELEQAVVELNSFDVPQEMVDLRMKLAAAEQEIAKLRGDRCGVCDEDGLIYVVAGYDTSGPEPTEIEEPEACPECGGTRSGFASRVRSERDAALAKVAELERLTVHRAIAVPDVRSGDTWVRWTLPEKHEDDVVLLRRDPGTPAWLWVYEVNLPYGSWEFFEFDVDDLDAPCELVPPMEAP